MLVIERKISQTKFILGLFLLLAGTNVYVLFGNLGKYISLSLGLFFIVNSIFNKKLTLSIFFFISLSFIYYFILVFLSFNLSQSTTSNLSLIFGFICIILFISGNIYGRIGFSEVKVDSKIVVLICILIILSSIKFFLMQGQISQNTSRDLGDENLNSVGVAYVQCQLAILLLWFFSVEKKMLVKSIILLGLFGVLIVVLLTESRGALVFLLLTIILGYSKEFFSKLKFKNIALIIISILVFLFFFKDNEVLNTKIEVVSLRFERAFNYANDFDEDQSLEGRKELQEAFFNNYDELYFGQLYYKPYPHNQYIEIYMRWGFFGIPILLISLISFYKTIKFLYVKKYNLTSVNFLILSIFLFSYLQSMSSLSLEMNRFLFFGFGFLLFNSKDKKNIKI